MHLMLTICIVFKKFASAGERAISARDLLYLENTDLVKRNNESNTRASTKLTMVGKMRVMSFQGIMEAWKKREEKVAAEAR